MKYLKIVKVTSSGSPSVAANDADIMQVVNVGMIESIVTAANTCIINYKGAGAVAGAVKTTITEAGKGKAIGDAVMNLIGKGHMHQGVIDKDFAGGVTTILSA
jgi:hypothetical protein